MAQWEESYEVHTDTDMDNDDDEDDNDKDDEDNHDNNDAPKEIWTKKIMNVNPKPPPLSVVIRGRA